MDVTKLPDIKQAFQQVVERLGPPAVLVNVAGTNLVTDSLLMTEADWNRILTLNLTGTFFCIQAALPHMLERVYGRIIPGEPGMRHSVLRQRNVLSLPSRRGTSQ